MEAHILGVQISDMTLNNVALPIALSGEKSWSYTGPCGKKLRKKNFSFRVGRYQEIRPTTPCWTYFLLFIRMCCCSSLGCSQGYSKISSKQEELNRSAGITAGVLWSSGDFFSLLVLPWAQLCRGATLPNSWGWKEMANCRQWTFTTYRTSVGVF